MKQNLKKYDRKNQGITLIALVITIIVMLILVGVTISMAVNGGLFNYAGKAVGETKNALDIEGQLANGGIEVDGVWYNSIDEYLDSISKPEPEVCPCCNGTEELHGNFFVCDECNYAVTAQVDEDGWVEAPTEGSLEYLTSAWECPEGDNTETVYESYEEGKNVPCPECGTAMEIAVDIETYYFPCGHDFEIWDNQYWEFVRTFDGACSYCSEGTGEPIEY